MGKLLKNNVTPEELEKLLETAWSRATSADPKGWNKTNPAWGQCAVTACVIQDHFGGTLLRVDAWIIGVGDPIGHYFNKLPDGTTVDLTRIQFPTDTIFSPPQERMRAYVLDPQFTTRHRYQLLKRRLRKILKTQCPA